MSVKVLLVHGIGTSQAGYSAALRRRVKPEPGAWIESLWGHVVDPAEQEILATRMRALVWRPCRRAFVQVVADAVLYGREEFTARIRAAVLETFMSISPRHEVVIFAHSLGTVIIMDALRDLYDQGARWGQDVATVRRIVLAGSPLRVFAAGPAGRPSGFALPRPSMGIINLICPRDPVAWPLQDWFPGLCFDVPVWFNPPFRPHTGYWGRRVTARVVREACRER